MPLFKKKEVSNGIPLVMPKTKQRIDAYHAVDIPSSTYVKPNFRQQCCSKDSLKEQALLIATIASVIIGIGVGIALRGLKCSTGKQRLSSRL
jgi:uncharacterized membrane-anchored protein YitT (DUF2179 family)